MDAFLIHSVNVLIHMNITRLNSMKRKVQIVKYYFI
jgi:hypothetical protein